MSVRVFNWNLLSTRLADPSYHIHSEPGCLDTEYRQQMVEQRLHAEVDTNSIICLQELSEEWLSFLIPKFEASGYTFLYDSQWLGAGIAFPRAKYTLKEFILENVGEELSKQCTKRVNTRGQNLLVLGQKTFRWMWNKLPRCIANFRNEPEDVWQIATKRINRFVGATLFCSDNYRSFNVYTYHFPCEFKRNDVMNIHAAGLLNGIQKHSNKFPYILAGDFNSTPTSSVYKFITQGIVPTFPTSRTYSIIPNLRNFYYIPLTSAYMFVQGKEPLFTCLGWPKDVPKAFKDTIDYIFCSNGFKATEVMPININLKTGTRSLPSAEEPSDHLPLRATFVFKDSDA